MGKGNIKNKRKNLTPDQKKKRLDTLNSDVDEYTIEYCWLAFMVNRETRGNTPASLDAYRRFYKKLCAVVPPDPNPELDIPKWGISFIDEDVFKVAFVNSLKDKNGKPVSQQTVNHYLRSYRAFGRFCEEQGYIPAGFSCPVKEVEPPLKEVYSEAELKKLLKEPNIEDFVAYRSFAIINLILTTGARSNTIRNIRIRDFNPETGYIRFNTTKAHKVIEEGLDNNCVEVLRKFVERWRSFADTDPDEYLFCNVDEHQISRDSLCKSIAKYNNDRGVEKTSLHLFRHTFAKMWLTSGGDVVSLARVLTHSELEMVKRYANLYSSDVKQEIQQHSALAQIKGKTRGPSIKRRSKVDS